jgi:O-methyltransferase involved in polyketide biosynthesis
MKKSKRENGGLNQVIILGAGLSPLSIEWKSRYPNMAVFDIDIDNMKLKMELVSQIKSQKLQEIRFITADLENSSEVEEALIKNGFKIENPSLVVMEGISYYLSKNVLLNLSNLFRKLRTGSRLVMDYLVPARNIADDRQHIPERIFNLIKGECNLSEINRYDSKDFESIFNAKILLKRTMMGIEKKRKGENILFPTSESGWIEICLLSQ